MEGIDIREIIERTVAEYRHQDALVRDMREQIEQLRKENVSLLERLAKALEGGR